jgi:predicted Zn-dependent protease with MMP-like domain
MDDQQFSNLVAQGIDAVPEEFAKEMSNVAIVIADAPSAEQKKKLHVRRHSYLLGIYEGVPKTKRFNYTLVLPDKITIFKLPILDIASGSESVIKRLVAETVWHEIGHHLGIGEDEIRKRQAKHNFQ